MLLATSGGTTSAPAVAYLAAALVAVAVASGWLRGRHAERAPERVAAACWAGAAAVTSILVAHALPSRGSGAAAATVAAVAGLAWADQLAAFPAFCGVVAVGGACVAAGHPGAFASAAAVGAVVALAGRVVALPAVLWVTVRVERSPAHRLVAARVPDPDLVATPRSPS